MTSLSFFLFGVGISGLYLPITYGGFVIVRTPFVGFLRNQTGFHVTCFFSWPFPLHWVFLFVTCFHLYDRNLLRRKKHLKIHGWNLRIRAPWKRKIIFQGPSFSGSMLITGANTATSPEVIISTAAVCTLFISVHQMMMISWVPLPATSTVMPSTAHRYIWR